MSGVTDEGRVVFGKWLESSRCRADTKQRVAEWLSTSSPHEEIKEFITQDQLGRWITNTTGFNLLGGKVGRLERAQGSMPPGADVIAALIRVDILLVEGKPATFDQVIDVLTGKLNPLANGSTKSFAN